MPNALTPAEALAALDAKIAWTREKFGPTGYVCFEMKDALPISAALHHAIRPTTTLTSETTK